MLALTWAQNVLTPCGDSITCPKRCKGGSYVPFFEKGAVSFVCSLNDPAAPEPPGDYLAAKCRIMEDLEDVSYRFASTLCASTGSKLCDTLNCFMPASTQADYTEECNRYMGNVVKLSPITTYNNAYAAAKCPLCNESVGNRVPC